MNKPFITISVIMLIMAGIGVYSDSQKIAYSQLSQIQKSGEDISQNSPFGAHGAFSRPFIESDKVSHEEILRRTSEVKEPYSHVQDIGIKWIRPGSDIYWRAVQPTLKFVKNGLFDWRSIDDLYGRVPSGVNILGTIDPLVWGVNSDPAFKPGTWEFASDEEEEYYIKFVKEVVERYDGDGTKDMPGLKSPVKYWQIGNEPAFRPLLGIRNVNKSLDWKGFSHITEISYRAIKDSDPSAKIALGGLASGYPHPDDPVARLMDSPPEIREREEFYVPLLKNLKGRYIDVFDIHYYGSLQEAGSEGWRWEFMKDSYIYIRQKLDENGYQNTEIWFTETAVPSQPFGERFQAINLIKRFVYPLSFGVKKIFWWNMIEGEYPLETDKPSNYFGLVYDGIGKGDPGYGTKKLSYYTYKKMVEVLEGSDWNNIKIIKESDGIYVYKFVKDDKPIYVAWNDNKKEKQITISGINPAKVRIIDAVPKYESGKDVSDYNAAFETEIKTVQNGKITIILGDNPVYVEEK
ncbi:MAG: hypothetical protein GXO83_04835 [Chlorobi bacterium]|nr:hypothetical protein [Chlorobiota bacterium]